MAFRLECAAEAEHDFGLIFDQRLFSVEAPAFDAFNAALDAAPDPNDGLRHTLRTPAPWDK